MEGYFELEGVTPVNYVLDKPAFSEEHRVQEYFNKPSLSLLTKYLKTIKEGRYTPDLSREEALLCKQFINPPCNKGITLERLEETKQEFYRHLKDAGLSGDESNELGIDETNVIVLGQNRDERIRLAIVDI